MNYIIIEDEDPAAKRLEQLIGSLKPEWDCIAHQVSVSSAVKWFSENEPPDLAFFDIQLSDGESFEIFNQVNVSCPVIFVTAFDQFALKAFKVNSIDYLLKPVKKEDLKAALEKFSARYQMDNDVVDYRKLITMINPEYQFQKRLLIRFGDTYKAIEMNDIAYFFTSDRTNYLCTSDDAKYPVDHNLDHIETITDPAMFIRVNRQFIVSLKGIGRMVSYPKSRIKLELVPPVEDDVIVSAERAQNFKSWLTGNKREDSTV